MIPQAIFHINHPWHLLTVVVLFVTVIIANKFIGRGKKRQLEIDDKLDLQPLAPPPLSDPYVLEIKNTRTIPATVRLFGFNAFWNKFNLGSDPGIEIKNLQGYEEIDYSFLFAQSATNPFQIGKIRIIGEEDFYKEQPSDFMCQGPARDSRKIIIHHSDSNGIMYTRPLLIAKFFDVHQLQRFIIDITKVITIDGRAHLSYELQPFEKIELCIWPIAIYSPRAALNNGPILSHSKPPQTGKIQPSPFPNEKEWT